MPQGVKVQVLSSAPVFTVKILTMALSTQPYKGARDFYPEDKRVQKYVFSTLRSVVEQFGYEEYDAPLIEPIELYAAKTGDEIVSEQTYSFEDRGGRQVVIRPEMTPSVARLVSARRQELAYPVRWYNIGSRWRYERPQRGRYREFYQLDVDIFGLDGLEAEVEIIQVADAVMQAFKAKRESYSVRLNSRQLINALLMEEYGLNEAEVHSLTKLIDRIHKMEYDQFVSQMESILSASQKAKQVGPELRELLKIALPSELPEKLQSHPSVKSLSALIKRLEAVGISNVLFDLSLMRGFDYYTDIVFEVFDNNPSNNRSMFGGGRYDGLVGLFGGESIPVVGFAMGDATLTNFLEVHKLLPEIKPETDAYVVLIGDVGQSAQPVLKELREMGLKLAVDYSGNSPDKQLKMADKRHLDYAIFIGDKELASGVYTLKNLRTGQQENYSAQQIADVLKSAAD